jgi:adenylosuccinate synthase
MASYSADPRQELASYPANLDTLDEAEVVYHEMPGWQTPTTNIKTFDELPKQARDYIEVTIFVCSNIIPLISM